MPIEGIRWRNKVGSSQIGARLGRKAEHSKRACTHLAETDSKVRYAISSISLAWQLFIEPVS